jgi:hypothetical protein
MAVRQEHKAKKARQATQSPPQTQSPIQELTTQPDLSAPQTLQRAVTQPRRLAPGHVQMLQRSFGNRAVVGLLTQAPARASPRMLQTELQAGGSYEASRSQGNLGPAKKGKQVSARKLAHVDQQGAVRMARPSGRDGVVQCKFDIDNRDWSAVTHIKRSGSGVEGVIFADAPEGQLILKFLDQAASVLTEEAVLRTVGVYVPRSKVIVGKEEVKAIKGKLKALSGQLEKDHAKQLKKQMKKRKYVQVMSPVKGTQLDKLDVDQLKTVLTTKSILYEIGRVAIVDAFMGNLDRLSSKQANLGNFMLAGGRGGPTLAAIDNETGLFKGSREPRSEEVKFILNPDETKQFTRSFLSNLCKRNPTLLLDEEKKDLNQKLFDDVEATLKKGIADGAKAIIDIMQDRVLDKLDKF